MKQTLALVVAAALCAGVAPDARAQQAMRGTYKLVDTTDSNTSDYMLRLEGDRVLFGYRIGVGQFLGIVAPTSGEPITGPSDPPEWAGVMARFDGNRFYAEGTTPFIQRIVAYRVKYRIRVFVSATGECTVEQGVAETQGGGLDHTTQLSTCIRAN